MEGSNNPSNGPHLRAIRSAIVALALAVLAAPLLHVNSIMGFQLGFIALIAIVFSFVPTISNF